LVKEKSLKYNTLTFGMIGVLLRDPIPAAELQHRYNTVTTPLQHRYETATTLLQHCYKTATTLLQHRYNTATRLLQHCYNTATTPLQHRYNTATTLHSDTKGYSTTEYKSALHPYSEAAANSLSHSVPIKLSFSLIEFHQRT